MADLKRYDMKCVGDGEYNCKMECHPYGDWVDREDHDREMQIVIDANLAHQNRIDVLEREIAILKDFVPSGMTSSLEYRMDKMLIELNRTQGE